jgi:hypothetical protein
MAIISRGLATLLCLLFTPLAVFFVAIAAGGGHGTYYAAKMLFPWNMMSTALTQSITRLFVVLGIAQYPLYGIVLDAARAKGHFKPAALTLAAVHILAVILAFAMSNGAFTP